MDKSALVLVGPPGAGKSTIYETYFSHLPLVDIDKIKGVDHQDRLKLRYEQLTSQTSPFVFCTAAPKAAQRKYWADKLRTLGFMPVIVVLLPPRLQAHKRMRSRGHHTRLARPLELWYKRYQPGRHDITISDPDTRRGFERAISQYGALKSLSEQPASPHPPL